MRATRAPLIVRKDSRRAIVAPQAAPGEATRGERTGRGVFDSPRESSSPFRSSWTTSAHANCRDALRGGPRPSNCARATVACEGVGKARRGDPRTPRLGARFDDQQEPCRGPRKAAAMPRAPRVGPLPNELGPPRPSSRASQARFPAARTKQSWLAGRKQGRSSHPRRGFRTFFETLAAPPLPGDEEAAQILRGPPETHHIECRGGLHTRDASCPELAPGGAE